MMHTNELESISHFSPLDEFYQFLEPFPDLFSSNIILQRYSSRSCKDKVLLLVFRLNLNSSHEMVSWMAINYILGIFRHYHLACDIFLFVSGIHFVFWNITCTVWNHHFKLNQSCVPTFNFSSLGNTINFNISKFSFLFWWCILALGCLRCTIIKLC